MKKLILVSTLALVVLFGLASRASAAVVCVNPDHAIWNADNSAIEGCISDATWNASLASQINQNDANDFVKVVRGQKLMTTFGEDTCFTWFPMDCRIKKVLFVKFF